MIVPRFVCLAPCDQTVLATPGQDLQVGGEGLLPSPPFQLDPTLARVTLKVSRSNMNMRVAGTALLGVGGGTTIVGLLLLPIGFANGSDGLKAATATLLVTGGTSLVLGAIFYATPVTRVEVIPGGVAF